MRFKKKNVYLNIEIRILSETKKNTSFEFIEVVKKMKPKPKKHTHPNTYIKKPLKCTLFACKYHKKKLKIILNVTIS